MKRKLVLLAISLSVAAIAALSIGAVVGAATPPDAATAATCPCGGYGNGGGWLGVDTDAVVAKLLGMTEADIQAQRQAGKSLVEIAKARNVTQQQLVDAIMAAKKAAVQSRVTAGTLTQERATIMLQQMEQATVQAVTRTTIGPPEGRGAGNGMGRFGQSGGSNAPGGFGRGMGRGRS